MSELTPINAEGSVKEGLRLFVQQIIDYAGLFPPSKLDMGPAVQEYARFLETDDAWMVARFVLPVARFAEFEEAARDLLPRGEDDVPWPISALTVPAGDDKLPEQLDTIREFNERHSNPENGLAVVDAIEIRGTSSTAIDEALDQIDDDIFPFFEIPVDEDPRGLIATLVGSEAGAKIRTGGVTADLYPSPEHVARFIATCAGADVAFKATAGLHHPLRHFSEAVQTDEFGFLNIFTAALLAMHREWDAVALVQVLTDEDAASFAFHADGMSYRDERFNSDELDDCRLAFALSFGSCSMAEPRDDLRHLGLI